MCGIVGYIGTKNASEVIIDGLQKLEYRGYDSAGIALNYKGNIKEIKEKGRLVNLKDVVSKNEETSKLGIGHTRWATHGEPNKVNAHPHLSLNSKIAVVHNGIIENYLELKDKLQKKGFIFKSDTDTEVVAHLIESHYTNDLLKAVSDSVKELKGSYALGVISNDDDKTLIAARKDSPLIIGVGECENFIASDITALIKHTRNVKYIMDHELVVLTKEKITILDFELNVIERETSYIDWDLESATKGGYDHYMLKEINEQPEVIDKTINYLLKNNKVTFPGIEFDKSFVNDISQIYVVACGTAAYAGLIGKYVLEEFANIKVNVVLASEFRYTKQFIDNKTLVIAASQSGETLDTLVSLKEAKKNGASILVITNVVGSSIAREGDYVIYTQAGPEIAVASTKAYTTQIVTFYLLAIKFAEIKKCITNDKYNKIIKELKQVSNKIEIILKDSENIMEVAEKTKLIKNAFFLGRAVDYFLACEASLKLKEISYVHAEAMPSGELKHGTIALIEEDTFVVVLAMQATLYEKTLSNIKEIKARHGKVFVVTKEDTVLFDDIADEIYKIPSGDDSIVPVYGIVPLQLFAYYSAVTRELDVDKPRNLAKSVTVE